MKSEEAGRFGRPLGLVFLRSENMDKRHLVCPQCKCSTLDLIKTEVIEASHTVAVYRQERYTISKAGGVPRGDSFDVRLSFRCCACNAHTSLSVYANDNETHVQQDPA